ncbi:MAG: alanine--glyoxylate aminotransferase family protein, partial [Lutibacter sp.]|nr:alanine--glyoxylate aminotransferase family protein [Lutibacter sp.]
MKKRKLLMIPGPIEFEPAVLQAMAKPTTSHVAPNFIDTFGNCLELMRKVWLSDTGQPFIVAGSGTLAMDMAAANLLEAGDRVLVIATGYFGDRYADLCQRYGADVRILSAAPGETVPMETIEKALATDQYKLVTMTHVDTATGVRINPAPIAKLAQQYGALSVLDGVCSVAGEEIRQEAWGLDVVLTASQKAIGVPPGLALLVVSQKAMQVYKNRNSVVGNYYADFTNWLPIMEAYENRRPAYFGTPPVNLIAALEVSLQSILHTGMEARFLRHQKIAQAFRAAVKALGLMILPKEEHLAANTMTAV